MRDELFNATKALESLMEQRTTMNQYGADELNEMLTIACRMDLSKPARKIAKFLHCTGNLPDRRKFLLS